MPAPDALVSELARAYALSELIPVDDARMRHLLEGAADALAEGGDIELEVRDGTLRGPDGAVGGAEDLIGELARDLEMAGVERLGFPADASVDSLLAFVDLLRQGSGSGDGERTARDFAVELPEIVVGFSDRKPRKWGPARAVAAVFGVEAGPGKGPAAAPVEMEAPPPTPAEPSGPPAPAPQTSPPAPPEPPESSPGSPARAPAGSPEPPAPSPESTPAAPAPSAPGTEGAAAPSGEEPPSPGAGEEPGEGELPALAAAYLEAPPQRREERAGQVRARAEELRRDRESEELAAGVKRLAGAGLRGPGDRDALELAREILVPGAATRIARELAETRDEDGRRRMIQLVSRLGETMAAAISEALSDTDERSARRAYIDAMVALGEDAMGQVEEMVEDSRWFVVRNGVSILGDIGGDEAIGHLTSTLGHEDARVRRETVMALAKLGGDDAATLILGMIDDPETEVRSAVAMALGVLRVEKAVRPLLERLGEEDDEDVQVQILRTLGQLGDPGAVPAIEKRAVASFFSRPPRPVRIAAYKALADIGTPHAVKLLEDAVDDKDAEVRAAVRGMLREREG